MKLKAWPRKAQSLSQTLRCFGGIRLKLTSEQEKAGAAVAEQAKSETGLNGLLAVVHQQWDLESLCGLILIPKNRTRWDAKNSRRITTLSPDSLGKEEPAEGSAVIDAIN